MAVGKMLITQETKQELGPAGMSVVTANLWPVDCQTCGKPLGERPPALCVQDMMIFAYANLHHPECHEPEWGDGTEMPSGSQPVLSHVTRMLMLPITKDNRPRPTPLMLINPGLEGIFLHRDEQQQWRLQHQATFREAGLYPPGKNLIVDSPIDGALVRLTDDSVAVTMQVLPYDTYECGLVPGPDDQFRQQITKLGGTMLGITHALHPHDDDLGPKLDQVLRTGQIILGWVGLQGTFTPRPSRGTIQAGTTLVLHWTPGHAIVGPLLAHTPKKLVHRKARSWAKRAIAPDAGEPMPWRPVDPDNTAAGWITTTTLTAQHFVLIQHSDGWRLVRALTRGGGGQIQTENEAKAWAAEVLKAKTKTTGLTWEAGPTDPGAQTLYATV
jgi:hypothetical protein